MATMFVTTVAPDLGVRDTLKAIQNDLGLVDKELALILKVEPSTLQNWRTGTIPQKAARERLGRLIMLHRELRETFRTPEGAKSWMHSPALYLGNITPAQALQHQYFDRVNDALEVLNSGMFL